MVLVLTNTHRIHQTPLENLQKGTEKGTEKGKYYSNDNLFEKLLPDIILGGSGSVD